LKNSNLRLKYIRILFGALLVTIVLSGIGLYQRGLQDTSVFDEIDEQCDHECEIGDTVCQEGDTGFSCECIAGGPTQICPNGRRVFRCDTPDSSCGVPPSGTTATGAIDGGGGPVCSGENNNSTCTRIQPGGRCVGFAGTCQLSSAPSCACIPDSEILPVGSFCTGSEQCASGNCVDNRCVAAGFIAPPEILECGDDISNCPDGFVCTAGECIEEEEEPAAGIGEPAPESEETTSSVVQPEQSIPETPTAAERNDCQSNSDCNPGLNKNVNICISSSTGKKCAANPSCPNSKDVCCGEPNGKQVPGSPNYDCVNGYAQFNGSKVAENDYCYGQQCKEGLVCAPTTTGFRCLPTPQEVKLAGIGDACDAKNVCAAGVSCTKGICTKPIVQSSVTCKDNSECSNEFICDLNSSTCVQDVNKPVQHPTLLNFINSISNLINTIISPDSILKPINLILERLVSGAKEVSNVPKEEFGAQESIKSDDEKFDEIEGIDLGGCVDINLFPEALRPYIPTTDDCPAGTTSMAFTVNRVDLGSMDFACGDGSASLGNMLECLGEFACPVAGCNTTMLVNNLNPFNTQRCATDTNQGYSPELDCRTFGNDLTASAGSSVVSANNSVVVAMGADADGLGNHLVVTRTPTPIAVSSSGEDLYFFCTYGHAQSFTPGLTVGQTVSAGQQIAQVGSEGNSTNAHLDFACTLAPLGFVLEGDLDEDGLSTDIDFDTSDRAWINMLPILTIVAKN